VWLKTFLEENSLGLLLSIPPGSPTPSAIIAFNVKTSTWPYTYPEIERLQSIAELMDNILTRSRLTEQAALRARMEHLAMLSRGLAHDLKNLITPVSSFLVHTEGKFAPDSPEAEVHAAARRAVHIMTDYVREALFFAQRLEPRFEPVDVAKLITAVHETVRPRLDQRHVTLQTFLAPSASVAQFTADSVLLQRLLVNLVTNASDASAIGQTVVLGAEIATGTSMRFTISDQGAGIAPEHLERIFDAYFTTKEFGDDIRGFGLGLTIARKIADLHGGSIRVSSRLGEGSVFTVDFPLVPASARTTSPRVRSEPARSVSTALS
jgi:signal transduction histidine kinase